MQVLQTMLFEQTINRAPIHPEFLGQVCISSLRIQCFGTQHRRFPFRRPFPGCRPPTFIHQGFHPLGLQFAPQLVQVTTGKTKGLSYISGSITSSSRMIKTATFILNA